MNVGFIHLHGVHPCHIAAEMERMEQHSAQGDPVHLFSCVGRLLACDTNIDHHRQGCDKCIRLRRRALSATTAALTTSPFPVLRGSEVQQLRRLPWRFQSAEALRDFSYENFDAGEAVLSSMISRYRNPRQDVVFDSNLVRRLLLSSVGVYIVMRREVRERGIRMLYVFNGRFAPQRAVLRACQAEQVTCKVHDRGHDQNHYHLYTNRMIHELAAQTREILDHWELADPNERQAVAVAFYEQRRAGVIPNWRSYTADQQRNLLPPNWLQKRRNVAIYISSEDEFAASGREWMSTVYPQGQEAAIRAISKGVDSMDSRIHLWTRVHPNLQGIDNSFVRGLLRMSAKNMTVIPSDSPVDSYALLDACEKVVTFGSTMGIEAVYWGKPSILISPAWYGRLAACRTPAAHDEVVAALCADLPRPDRTGALQYGYYMNSFGTRFQVYEAFNAFEGRYRNVVMDKKFFLPAPDEKPNYLPLRQKLWLLQSKWAMTRRLIW